MTKGIVERVPFNYEAWVKDYYTHTFICGNCETANKCLIKRGILIGQLGVECENCGCNT